MVKVNAYGDALVDQCSQMFRDGEVIVVEGELMNRKIGGRADPLLEVRASRLETCAP